jgi:hypothetical protein
MLSLYPTHLIYTKSVLKKEVAVAVPPIAEGRPSHPSV